MDKQLRLAIPDNWEWKNRPTNQVVRSGQRPRWCPRCGYHKIYVYPKYPDFPYECARCWAILTEEQLAKSDPSIKKPRRKSIKKKA